MKEDQVRLVLALGLSALVLIVWQHFFGPKPRAVAALAFDGGAEMVAASPSSPTDGGAPVAMAAATPSLAAPPPLVPSTPNPPEQTVQFDSKLRHFTFSSYGGALKSAVLEGEQFKRKVEGKEVQVDLVQVRRSGDPAHPGPDPLPLAIELSKGLPPISADLPFQVEKQADGVVFTAQVGDLTIVKHYRLPADGYDVQLDVTLRNRGAQVVAGELTAQVDGYSAPNPEEGGGGFFGNRGPTEARTPLDRIADKTNRRNPDKDKGPQTDEGQVVFAGLDERYFLTALYPVKDKTGSATLDAPVDGLRRALVTFPISVPAAGEATRTFGVYLGPKLQETLHEAGWSLPELKGATPDLEAAVDYGSVAVISTLLLKIMRFFHSVVPNWGLAIILLTVTVKGVLFPLTNKQMASMESMRALQPHIEELKKKYPDDKERQNMEMMKLYTAHKVNPLGGCLPTLVQMPVWWGLYRTLEYAFDLYRQPFIGGWINDLSVMDPTYLLPLAMGVSMFVTQKMQPQMSTDATQQKMMLYFMPIFFTFVMKSLPSGLNLYIFCNNLLSIAQQSYLRRKYPRARAPMTPAKA